MSDYQYTDQQLNNLNQKNAVYSVNPGFVKRNSTDDKPLLLVTDKRNPGPNETNKVKTDDGQRFQVIKVYSDPKTGFDGMAVAPIVNGEPDYNNVAIIAAGTDNQTVDFNTALSGGTGKDGNDATFPSHLSIQYQSALKFVDSVKNDPKYRVVQLSGYSQGSYMLKVGAKYGIPTTTFNAWFRYNSLTDEEIDFISKNPQLFKDYRNDKDYVVFAHDDNQPHHYGYVKSIGTIRWVDGFSHNIEGWYFDPKTGLTLDKKGGKPLVPNVSHYQAISAMQMKNFASLKKKWRKSGGKLSKSEKIFLDAVQAQMLGTNMAGSARSGADEAVILQNKAVQDVQDIWNKIDFTSYTELSPSGVEAAFASYGVTQNFISDFQTDTQKVVEKMTAIANQFDTLKGQLDKVITSLEETDTKLAGDFNAWEQGM